MPTSALPASPTPVQRISPGRWPAAIWALLASTLVVRAGGFAYPFLSYHLGAIGFTTETIGQILTLFGVGWLLGQIACGWSADRLGRRSTLLMAMATATIALPLLAQARALPVVLACALIVGIVYDAPRPIVSAAIADLIPDDAQRAAVNGWRHFAVNIGAAVTGAAGGLLAGMVGIAFLLWANAAACTVCAAIVLRYMGADQCPVRTTTERGSYHKALRDGRLLLVSLASLAALTCAAGMFSTLPMLMSSDGLPASAYGWTQVTAAAAVVIVTPALNPWMSQRADRGKPLIALFATSSLLLGLGMGSAGFMDSTLGYSVAVAAAVPGEIIFFIAASDILNRLAPAADRGIYHGIWGTTLAGAVIVAPILAAWSLTRGGPSLAAATTFTAGLLGAALCVPLAALMHRRITPAGCSVLRD